mgnify:FL=1
MKRLTLQLADYWYPATVFGKGNKLAIWFQGCSKKCLGCISPEYQSYNGGKKIIVDDLLDSFRDEKPEGLVISGGEPFDQPEALLYLVKEFESRYGEDILVYTGYQLKELQDKKDDIYKRILEHVAVLIDGKYEASLDSGTGLAGSSNQMIYLFKKQEKYQEADKWKRNMMCILKENGDIWLIGVPPNG